MAGAGIYWYMNRPNVQEAEVQPTEEVLVTPDSLTTSPAPDTLSTSPTVAKDTTQGTEIVTKPVVAAPIPKVDASLASLTKGGLAEQFATYLADTSKITGKVFSYGNLEFDPASANLSTASDAKIAELVKVLGKYPNAQVKIMGYVSKTADSLKAKTLSFKRANAVKMLIVAKGVNIIRIDAVGRGRSTAVPRIDLKVIRK